MYVCMCVHVVHVCNEQVGINLLRKNLRQCDQLVESREGQTSLTLAFVSLRSSSLLKYCRCLYLMAAWPLWVCTCIVCTKSFHCLDNSHMQVLASRSVLWFCVLIQQQNSHVVTHLDIQFRCGASIFDGSTVIGQCCFLLGSKINKVLLVLVYTHYSETLLY